MSVTYALAVTASQADSYVNDGVDFFGGFAVDARILENLVSSDALIPLFNLDLPGSPFAPDRPIDILEVPANPFIQARHAVGPQDSRAILGGIIEYPPYDGTGVVRLGNEETDLLWIEPTRLSTGSRLLRYYPGQKEPQLRAVFHGITWGWENVETGEFCAFTPSNLIGPSLTRAWGSIPVDIEYDNDGNPSAVQMVSPAMNENEGGFEPVESGFYAKRIAYQDDMDIFEPHIIGRINSIPVRVIRTLAREDGTILAFCVALILDMPLVLNSGFDRWNQAFAVITVPIDEVEAQMQPITPPELTVKDLPAATLVPDDAPPLDRMVTHIFTLASAVAPLEWEKASILVQLVGNTAASGGVASYTDSSGEEQTVPFDFVPSAISSYATWIKENNLNNDNVAPISIVFNLNAQGRNVNIALNYDDEPEFAEGIDKLEWQREVEKYPRPDNDMPQWLRERIGK